MKKAFNEYIETRSIVTRKGGMKMKKKNLKRISEFLEIPREVTSNVPKITIIGFDEMLIENYKGILEYEDFFIKIKTHHGCVNINGFELKLNQMTEDDILVSGKIESIDWEKIGR